MRWLTSLIVLLLPIAALADWKPTSLKPSSGSGAASATFSWTVAETSDSSTLPVQGCGSLSYVYDHAAGASATLKWVGASNDTASTGTSIASFSADAKGVISAAPNFLILDVSTAPSAGTAVLTVKCTREIASGGGTGGGAGGDAATFSACATGNLKGGGFTDNSDNHAEYDWTCANYNWSAEFGGTITDTDDATIPAGSFVGSWNTATTTGGNRELIDCTGDGSGVSRLTSLSENEGSCLNSGELVYKNAAADIILAIANTKNGGSVYFPMIDGKPTIVEINGTGCKNTATGADDSDDQDCATEVAAGRMTQNNAPVLASPLNINYIHRPTLTRGITFQSELRDFDGPFQNGRKGVIFSLDTSNEDASNPTKCPDPGLSGAVSGPSSYMCRDVFNIGGFSLSERRCFTLDEQGGGAGDVRCDVEGKTAAQALSGIAPSLYPVANTALLNPGSNINRQSPNTSLCIPDLTTAASATGICVDSSGDATQVPCDTDSGDSCDDIDATWTCTSLSDQIAVDAVANNEMYLAVLQTAADDAVQTSFTSGKQDSFYGITQSGRSSFGNACAGDTDGDIINLGPWGNTNATLGTGRGAMFQGGTENVTVLDAERWFNEDGGWKDMFIMSESWDGRDSAVNNFDCNDGVTSTVNYDVQCDRPARLLAGGMTFKGEFRNIHLWNVDGGFHMDVSGGGTPLRMGYYNININNMKSGIGCGDINGIVDELYINNSDSCSLAFFGTESSYRRVRLYNVTNSIITVQTKNSIIEDIKIRGSQSSKIQVAKAAWTTIRDIECIGNMAECILIRPADDEKVMGVTLDGVRVRGFQAWNTLATSAKAPIIIDTNLGASLGDIWGLVIKNVYAEFRGLGFGNSDPDACLVYIDDEEAPTAPDYITSLDEITLMDSGILVTNPSGSETTGLICIDGFEDALQSDAGTDENIWKEPYVPIMLRNSINGVPYPDQPYKTVDTTPATACGDCAATPAAATSEVGTGAICRLNTDTAVGACTDAGADGVLDGGGTAVSVCVCEAGTWLPLY